MRVLNVGGGMSVMPDKYSGWDVVVLDIDPEVKPDLCMDARDIARIDEASYDAVFCSHNLEHFYAHEVPDLLKGFRHVLKPGGFVEIHVPDLHEVAKGLVTHEPTDVAYEVDAGPVTYHDIIYGWNVAMSAGNPFYAHKCGFTANSLGRAVFSAGFDKVDVWQGTCADLLAYGVKL